ncbi:hypothetical protein, partial [Arthrobacter sp. TS-15]|uniref:hypothetical protein n=1 Tax=Arthrobacter sp. TS-15 TaxID=2510797 RepID=UPI00406D3B7C
MGADREGAGRLLRNAALLAPTDAGAAFRMLQPSRPALKSWGTNFFTKGSGLDHQLSPRAGITMPAPPVRAQSSVAWRLAAFPCHIYFDYLVSTPRRAAADKLLRSCPALLRLLISMKADWSWVMCPACSFYEKIGAYPHQQEAGDAEDNYLRSDSGHEGSSTFSV